MTGPRCSSVWPLALLLAILWFALVAALTFLFPLFAGGGGGNP